MTEAAPYAKMPALCDAIAREQAAGLDQHLSVAISNYLGTEEWVMADIKQRITRIVYPNSDLETIRLDGEPIFQMGPVKLETFNEGDRFVVKASRSYRILNERKES